MESSRFVIRPDRVRRVPPHFSWLDQRLVREGRLRQVSHAGCALYLFLATVADRNGMSWYSPRRICLELGMDEQTLSHVRAELVSRELIAYASPFYQLIALCSRPERCDPRAPEVRDEGEGAATRDQVSAIVTAALAEWGA